MRVSLCLCSLGGNLIGEVGGKAIGDALKNNRYLQTLGCVNKYCVCGPGCVSGVVRLNDGMTYNII